MEPGQTSRDARLLCVRTWHLPDLKDNEELQSTTADCDSKKSGLCINPFHFYKVVNVESESCVPDVCALLMELQRLKEKLIVQHTSTEPLRVQLPGDSIDLSSVTCKDSITFSGDTKCHFSTTTTSSSSTSQSWCSLAYWEGRHRIGRPYVPHSSQTSVFFHRPMASGLCLDSLTKGLKSSSNQIRAREKIGHGITLVMRSYENDVIPHVQSSHQFHVFVYNQSEHAVFVHSPTLQPLTSSSVEYRAVRVPPHSCLKAFDSLTSHLMHQIRSLSPEKHFTDSHSLRISFVKGFGSNYQRQDIISCPCWLEVHLGPSPLL